MSVKFLIGNGENGSSHGSSGGSSGSTIDQNLMNKIQNLIKKSFKVFNKGKFFELELIKEKNNGDLAFIKKDEKHDNTQSIYIYQNGAWELLLNALTLEDAINFLIDDKNVKEISTFSSKKLEEILRKKVNQKDLAPVAKTNSYFSLNDLPKIPKKTSDLIKDDIYNKTEVDKKLEALKKLKEFLDSIAGKVKNNKDDEPTFLSDKLDNKTIEISKENFVHVVSLEGLELTVDDLNLLKPIVPNVEAIIHLVDAQNPLNQFDYKGAVASVKELETKENKAGDMYLVINDENHEQKQTMYISDGKKFSYICDINGDKLSRDFFEHPISLKNEITDVLNEKHIDKNIARKKELEKKIDLVNNATENNIAILDAKGNLKDGLKSLDDLAKKKHEHDATEVKVQAGLFEKNFDETDVNLQKILNKLDTLDFDLTGLIEDDSKKGSNKTYSIDKLIELFNNKMDKDGSLNLSNLDVLKALSKDKENNLLFDGKKINTDVDLSKFTTKDLKESKDKRYITDVEKNNLNKVDTFVKQQNSINTKLNKINQSIPSDVSGTNPLISNNILKTKMDSLKFSNLMDVEKPLKPNGVLTLNSDGTKIIAKDKLSQGISEISDINSNMFLDVRAIGFKDLKGTLDPKSKKLNLSLDKISSKKIIDMPKEKIEDGVLVSNINTNRYELKDMHDIFKSQENFCKDISKNSWSSIDNKFKTFVDHNLNSENLVVAFYDENKNKIDLQYKIEDKNLITVHSDNPIECRCIVNCSQSGKNGNGGGSGSGVNASDIINDGMTDIFKTYSSNKIEEKFRDTLNKEDAYNKNQCDNLFASKQTEHWHNNTAVLNEFKEDSSGNLTYKDKRIMMKIKPFFYECHWDSQINSTLDDILTVKDIYDNKNYVSIMNSEFTIKNIVAFNDTKKELDEEDYVYLKVFDNGMLILDVKLTPDECQKYDLGISPNITIQVKGSFDANYYVTAL